MKDSLTVVIPTLNEEEAIGQLIDELKMEGYQKILVVDGYSSDRTVEIAKDKGVEVVYQHGSGKAGAIMTAVKYVKTPYMLVMDGDLTYSPRDIEHLLRYVDRYDEVIGLRMNRYNIPLIHRFGNRLISLVFSLLIGRRVNDPCSGMYLLKTESIKRLELTSSGFDIEVEIAAQLCFYGEVTEVPITYRRRVGRGKLQTWRAGFNILLTILKMCWLYNPVFLFSALAALLAAPGVAILLWQLYIRYLYGAGAWSLGWVWLGLVLLIIGLQGFTVSIISLLLKRMERRIVQQLKENK